KQGSSFLEYGYERSVAPSFGTTADSAFTKGTPNVWDTSADFVVHPPVGKWMIAGGEWLFGADNPVGWRFSVALCGTLSILLLARISRRLFGSTLLGCTSGVLLAFEGHHFVHSRTGLLDLFVMFWALAAFGALLLDRDHARRQLAERLTDRHSGEVTLSQRRIPGAGPTIWWRPWRIVAGICLGLCCGTKWSGLYFVLVFGLMTVLWDAGARRKIGARRWFSGAIFRDGPLAVLAMIPIALAAYLASWMGWFLSRGAWGRTWAADNPQTEYGFIPQAVRSLWHYHADMYRFHVGLESFHSYKANPWSWLVQGRPTSFFYETNSRGEAGCEVEQCSAAITSLGTPLLWWGSIIALVVVLLMWALGRDWRAGAILAGIAAGYLPWFAFQERTIYTFYAVAFVPWLVLAVTYALGLCLGPARASARRRFWGSTFAGSYVVACVVMFFFFWPVYTAQVIPYAEWARRMWLPSWI
ncbi:MAG: dolichyl-phosphate-mannose--protein mannosyltransferase, partial [Angustibacter sp.]